MPLAKRALARRAVTGLPAMALLLLALLLGFAADARADAYTVSGIAVDVEADDAVTARGLAIEEAQQQGLRELLERLTTPEHYGRLPAADQQPLGRLVNAFEVEEENVSATRYVGRITVVYDPDAVQGMLSGTGVPIVLELPPPLLVVPALLDEAGSPEVFGEAAGWRDAWAAEAGNGGLLDLQLPLGDLGDLRALGGQALASDAEAALATAAERHDVGAAILLVARPDDPLAPTRVTVNAEARHGWPAGFDGDSIAMDADAETVWRAAVRRTMQGLENDWKAEHLISMDRLAALPVDVALDGFEAWADIRRRLAQVAAVRRVDIEAFSQTEAALIFNHIGTVGQLQRALEARGLQLMQGAGTWRLRRTAGQPAG